MREHGVDELLLRGLEVHRHDIALDQLGHLRADHVRAEQRPGLLVEDHLDETLVLAQRDRLAVADEWKAADADIELVLLRRLLGEADRGDLRRAIGAARDEALVHGMRLEALDRLGADDALVLGLVREQRRPRPAPPRVKARSTVWR